MKKFTKMTAAQKRVAIAKDVLKQIKAGRVRIHMGSYLKYIQCPVEDFTTFNQSTLLADETVCRVCAVGAAIVSGLRLFNGAEVGDLEGDGLAAYNAISRWFSKKQSALIEQAFEDSCAFAITREALNSEWQSKKASEFKNRRPNKRSRAISIFQNIIDNKGLFKP